MGAKQVMVFPFTVPMDGGGQMRDAAQGVYARSLARTLAERLSVGPGVSATAATLTADGLEGRAQDHGWVVASHPWTLEEACAVGLPEGTEYLLHGAAELTDRVRLRLILVDQKERRTALDHVVLRPRSELFGALEEAAGAVAQALGLELPAAEWPTGDVEAYVAYLRGRDRGGRARHRSGEELRSVPGGRAAGSRLRRRAGPAALAGARLRAGRRGAVVRGARGLREALAARSHRDEDARGPGGDRSRREAARRGGGPAAGGLAHPARLVACLRAPRHRAGAPRAARRGDPLVREGAGREAGGCRRADRPGRRAGRDGAAGGGRPGVGTRDPLGRRGRAPAREPRPGAPAARQARGVAPPRGHRPKTPGPRRRLRLPSGRMGTADGSSE